MRKAIPFRQLFIDEVSNVRKTYRNIPDLAKSIHEHGLLQNLVVVEDRSLNGVQRYKVECGGRRFFAIELLVKSSAKDYERYNDGWPVDCLIKPEGADEAFRNLAENLQREPVPAWQLGRRYNELREMLSLTQTQVAQRIGKTQGHVSIHCQIADGLAPAVVSRLEKMPTCPLANSQLIMIAKLYDEKTFGPNEKEQLSLLDQFLGHATSRPRPGPRGPRKMLSEKERVLARYEKLKRRGVRIPGHALPYVNAIMRYLRGDDSRLTFPE